MKLKLLLGCAVIFSQFVGTALESKAEELNIYSSRHYQTDERLYSDFTKLTGIKVNRVDGKGDQLIERLKKEGRNSPADLLITVDAGRLWRAEQAGLFQSVNSSVLDEKVPANFRHPDNKWFGFSSRARVIFFNKNAGLDLSKLKKYEDLARPEWKNRLCIRSSSNIYNLSLMSSIIHNYGVDKAEKWASGLVSNFARNPQGGDTDQIRAVAARECDFAVGNSYYYVRLLKSEKANDKKVVENVGVIFPNQGGRGAHVNISGAGVLKYAPNRDAAVKFLEYLVSDQAQAYFATGNNEYPVVKTIEIDPALASLGDFDADQVNVSVYGKNQPQAQKAFDRAGFN